MARFVRLGSSIIGRIRSHFFSIASTDPSECSIALDNVAHVIAAEIDGCNDDDATMEELSENEDFYLEDDLREQNEIESKPEEDNHSDVNLDEDVVVTLPATHTVVTRVYLAQLKTTHRSFEDEKRQPMAVTHTEEMH